jgi:steroid delta-isomerase-like uncharacterized protein
MLTPLEVAQQYLEAWNAHDAAAMTALFVRDGYYRDPNGDFPVVTLAAYAIHLWQSFPDLRFETQGEIMAGEHTIAVPWLMKGTNSGAFHQLAPTHRSITLQGIDVLHIEHGKIKSVQGYFDRQAIPSQLGLQVLTQPDRIGPFCFGYSIFATTEKRTQPGAFSITTIWNHPDDLDETKLLARETGKELLEMDGFIGLAIARNGDRGVTMTAWETPEDAAGIYRSPAHQRAMQRFQEGLGYAAFTSTWVPLRVQEMRVRCQKCLALSKYEPSAGRCACGAALPEPPPYF